METNTPAPIPDEHSTARLANQRWFYDESTQTIRDENALCVANIGRNDAGGHEDGKLAAAAPQLLAAVLVFCTDRRICAWLKEHDPKALEQGRAAVVAARVG